jgi:hypothetical protein
MKSAFSACDLSVFLLSLATPVSVTAFLARPVLTPSLVNGESLTHSSLEWMQGRRWSGCAKQFDMLT